MRHLIVPDLDARNFFNIKRPPFKLNQFGGTIGGPIKKNKTFFFFSAQDTERRSAPRPISITTPSAAERAGNFSSIATPIINPVTGKQFPGNIIPIGIRERWALPQDPSTFEYRAQAVKVWGAHTINFGSAFERTRIDANDYSYTPGDNTFNGQVTGSALADFYLGYESQFFQDNGRTFYLREDRPSVYVQDDWKVSRQFTLNLGLRWDP